MARHGPHNQVLGEEELYEGEAELRKEEPYEEVIYADLVHAVANSALVTDDTVILIEYPIELGCMPHVISRDDGGKLIGVRNRKYGRTVSSLFNLAAY